MSSVVAMNAILEKIASKDKDFRYMATSDLQGELAKDNFRTDGETEKKLCHVILQQLDDISGDISGLAVKCLGLLVHKITDNRLQDIAESLCQRLTSVSGKKAQQRDIASIGLKTVIAEASGNQAQALVTITAPLLVDGLSKPGNMDVLSESLDITGDLLARFGNVMSGYHSQLRVALLPHLEETRPIVRKRAIQCMASLALHLSGEQLDEVNKTLIAQLQQRNIKPDAARTYVQTIGAVSRSIGYRFGKHLPAVIPLVIKFSHDAAEGDDELREHCLQALEAFVQHSPHEARPSVRDVFDTALQFLNYDPNYADTMDEDEEEEDDQMEDDDDLSDEEYSDDEDVSWKVRRAAAKCLQAIIESYPDLLRDIYPKAATALIARFKEREENVKSDIFQTFIELVKQLGSTVNRFEGSGGSKPIDQLRSDVPSVIKAAVRQLKEKSVRTKQGVFAALQELVTVVPDSIATHTAQMMPGIQAALTDKSQNSSNLKIPALTFLRTALESTDPSVWQKHLPVLSPAVFATVGERYYKVTAQGLRVAERLIFVIRPSTQSQIPGGSSDVVNSLYKCVMSRLMAQDQDQEVKDCAISCMAAAVSQLGDVITPQLPQVLQVLLERLRNEITRLTAVKAFASIAQSPLSLNLSPVLEPLLAELTSFLRKANRVLRQASLSALEVLIAGHGSNIQPGTLKAAVDEVAPLVNDTDLLIAALSLTFCTTLLQRQPQQSALVTDRVLPAAMTLSKSPLLQGSALHSLQIFFQTLVASKAKSASFEALLAALLAAGHDSQVGKTAQHNIAQCIAVLCTAAGPNQTSNTVKALLSAVQGSDETASRLALFSLGEIGRCTDLSKFKQLQSVLTSSLDSSSEDVKAVASQALGGVAIGNLSTYLPFILRQIQNQAENPKQQYLLLRALNEVITSLTGDATLPDRQQDEVLQLLFSSCETEEECRNVVAECLGHLALLYPSKTLLLVQQQSQVQSEHMRTVVVMAMKFTLVDSPHPVDAHLHQLMPSMLSHMQDQDRHVRKAAVQLLSTAAHNKPGLILDHLPSVLPLLYQQTTLNPALVREVDLGPFKHKIDDGLELRKAAFECMDVLLERCKDRINMPEFITHLEQGLQDHYDVKMPCHLLLAKLAAAAPGPVLTSLDRLFLPLEKTLTTRLRGEPVKQEVDRNEDMVRSCLRAIEAVNRIPNVNSCAPFKQFMSRTVLTGAMATKYNMIKEERAEAEGTESMDMS
ncbi:hypothetical protein WJX82_000009 [Trebouxia sp. C0006]